MASYLKKVGSLLLLALLLTTGATFAAGQNDLAAQQAERTARFERVVSEDVSEQEQATRRDEDLFDLEQATAALDAIIELVHYRDPDAPELAAWIRLEAATVVLRVAGLLPPDRRGVELHTRN